MNESLPCARNQHAYRPRHSTVTALLPIATKVAIGFNAPKPPLHTAMVNLDIAKAFDVVSHDLLLEMVSNSELNSNLVRWLKTYMRGRTAVCLFQGAISRSLKCHSGTPQGGVISPKIFNYYVSDFPNVAEQDDSYADDFDLLETSSNVDELGPRLTEDLVHVSEWAKKKELTIAPSKSSVTLFTPDKHQSNYCPVVTYEGVPIPLKTDIKYLGLNFNKHGAYSSHTGTIDTKIQSRHQLLKATSGQDWGDKEVLRSTYKSFIKPVITYAAPVYFPSMGPKHSAIAKLQRSQNAVMRTITGAYKNSSTNHLLAEAELLSVSESLELSCRQFLVSVLRVNHPSHLTVNLSTGQRIGRKGGIVHTLQSRYRESVEHYLTDGVVPEAEYKKIIKDIHTKTVDTSKKSLINNVLGGLPPAIHLSERSLPRLSRRTLCQLREDRCIGLETFKHKIGTAPDDLCPLCHNDSHISQHLFDCPASPTNLNFHDLWKRPREAVNFLRTLDFFNHLPPNPPYPRPPAEPPPATSGVLD